MIENGKTLFSKKVPGGSRTYFIDVRQSEKSGARYLVMSESRKVGENWQRHSVMVFSDHAVDLKSGLDEAFEMMKE